MTKTLASLAAAVLLSLSGCTTPNPYAHLGPQGAADATMVSDPRPLATPYRDVPPVTPWNPQPKPGTVAPSNPEPFYPRYRQPDPYLYRPFR